MNAGALSRGRLRRHDSASFLAQRIVTSALTSVKIRTTAGLARRILASTTFFSRSTRRSPAGAEIGSVCATISRKAADPKKPQYGERKSRRLGPSSECRRFRHAAFRTSERVVEWSGWSPTMPDLEHPPTVTAPSVLCPRPDRRPPFDFWGLAEASFFWAFRVSGPLSPSEGGRCSSCLCARRLKASFFLLALALAGASVGLVSFCRASGSSVILGGFSGDLGACRCAEVGAIRANDRRIAAKETSGLFHWLPPLPERHGSCARPRVRLGSGPVPVRSSPATRLVATCMC